MALFKTTDDLANFVRIDVNTDFDRLKPKIESAERDFIKPLLGSELYADLSAAYTAAPGTPLPAAMATLLPYVQKTLAEYAMFLLVDQMGVSVGEMGLQQQSGQNSQPAPAWKVKDLKSEYITSADRSADMLLEFLELAAVIPDGGVENDRIYKKWYDSEANTAISGCIVYKTSIASRHIDINDSRRLFLRLKKRIREIEGGYVKRLVCTDQYDQLVTQLKSSNVTPENQKLITYLEPIIAKRALYATLPLLPIVITADGLFLYSSNDSVIQKMQASATEKEALLKQLKEGQDTGYENDERALQAFLDSNIADYPLISNSPCWNGTTTATDERWKVENDPNNKHFSV